MANSFSSLADALSVINTVKKGATGTTGKGIKTSGGAEKGTLFDTGEFSQQGHVFALLEDSASCNYKSFDFD